MARSRFASRSPQAPALVRVALHLPCPLLKADLVRLARRAK
jgi:hypothetical protein